MNQQKIKIENCSYATSNPGKLLEMQAYLADFDWELSQLTLKLRRQATRLLPMLASRHPRWHRQLATLRSQMILVCKCP